MPKKLRFGQVWEEQKILFGKFYKFLVLEAAEMTKNAVTLVWKGVKRSTDAYKPRCRSSKLRETESEAFFRLLVRFDEFYDCTPHKNQVL